MNPEHLKAQKKMLPLKFGSAHEVREWEKKQEHIEFCEAAREEGYDVLTGDEKNRICSFALRLCDGRNEPVRGDVMRPLHDLLYDDCGEIREAPQIEDLIAVYDALLDKFSDFQEFIEFILNRFD